MTKGELLELLSDLEDSDKLVFVSSEHRMGRWDEEYRNASLVWNRSFETELHLKK